MSQVVMAGVEFGSLYPKWSRLGYNHARRVPAHYGVTNLVRSGTKQPQSFTVSAADQARLFPPSNLFLVAQRTFLCHLHLNELLSCLTAVVRHLSPMVDYLNRPRRRES